MATLLSAITDALAAGRTLLFLSDFDGTLSEIVDHPGDARLAREARDNLRALAKSPRVRVGILSGRALAELRSLVGVPDIIYAGSHGLEVDGPGIRFTHPGAAACRADLVKIAEDLRPRLESISGVVVEMKELCIAVHYRHVVEADLDRVAAEVAAALRARSGLTLLRGKQVVDILPAVEWSKGHCALRIRDQLASTAPSGLSMAYLGDDTTDETAFSMLPHDALTVRIGGGGSPSAARFRLAEVADVHRLVAVLTEDILSRSRECV